MKALYLLIIACLIQGCANLKPNSYAVINPDSRTYLIDMKFKNSFKPEMASLIDENVIYYRYYKNESINFELHSGIRFFKSGQYIGYGSKEELDHSIFTQLNKGGIGYYNSKVKDSIVIIESANLLYRRSGKRNLDKYKVLPNGDLKSITRQASDYNAIYKKINLNESNLKELVPDW